MHSDAPTLWYHSDFVRLWSAQTISVFGSAISGLAIPLTAIQILHATPAQMGILNAVTTLPFLLVGLLAGVLIDRMRRRPFMILADLARSLLLSTLVVAAFFHLSCLLSPSVLIAPYAQPLTLPVYTCDGGHPELGRP